MNKKNYKPQHDIPIIVKELGTLSPTRIARYITSMTNEHITKQAISVWFKRNADVFNSLANEIGWNKLPSKHIKNLRFELTTKEYSDFWYIASLLKCTKKNEVFRKMMNIVKEQSS